MLNVESFIFNLLAQEPFVDCLVRHSIVVNGDKTPLKVKISIRNADFFPFLIGLPSFTSIYPFTKADPIGK